MKLNFKPVQMLALGALALLTFSCKDEATEGDLTAYQGEATIYGTVYIETDETTDNDVQERASDLTIRVSYDAGDLNVIGGDDDTETIVITTTTDASGNYSVTVPTNNNGVDFTVSYDEYTTTYVHTVSETKDGETTTKTETLEVVFPSDSDDVDGVKIGESKYLPFYMGNDYDYELNEK